MGFDLAVIGAGITGAAVFEAAGRAGLSTALVERGRPGGATTAVTSSLLHGGLRYLPYDAATSLAMCREIARLRAEAPGLLTRRLFLWPAYSGDRVGPRLLDALLGYYDAFADLRGSPGHVRLSAAEARELLPGLEARGLRGAAAFDEWHVDVAGLMSALLARGAAAGGLVLEGHRVTALLKDGRRVRALAARAPDGRTVEVEARVIVNAAGPWSEAVAAMAGARTCRLSLRKGAHLVIPGEPPACGLIFPEPGGHYVGLYPRSGESWVGPTDDAYAGDPDACVPDGGDEARLRAGLARVLPAAARSHGRCVAGLRPIYRQALPGPLAGLLSRDHRFIDHAEEGIEGFVSVIGGKLTTHRPMAEEAVAAVSRKLGRRAAGPARASPDGALRRALGCRSRAVSMPLSAAMLGLHAALAGLGARRGRAGLAAVREAWP